jgi:hypothetical protein
MFFHAMPLHLVCASETSCGLDSCALDGAVRRCVSLYVAATTSRYGVVGNLYAWRPFEVGLPC